MVPNPVDAGSSGARPVFWWVNLIKLPAYVQLGMLNRRLARRSRSSPPIAVAGVFLGVWTHRRASDTFFRLTYTLLAVTGAKLVWDALT